MSKPKLKRTIFYYRGNEVRFYQAEKCVIINATQLGKPFKRKPDHFLRRWQAQEYIHTLTKSLNVEEEDLINIKQYGNIQGTLMHESVAMEFARWLSADLADWLTDRLNELAKTGVSGEDALTPEMMTRVIEGLKERMERLQKRVKALEQENTVLYEQNKTYEERILDTDKVITALNTIVEK